MIPRMLMVESKEKLKRLKKNVCVCKPPHSHSDYCYSYPSPIFRSYVILAGPFALMLVHLLPSMLVRSLP